MVWRCPPGQRLRTVRPAGLRLRKTRFAGNIDDGTLTSYVKTKLASDKLVTLTRVGVETNNGVVYLTGEVETAEQRSRIGSLASEVKGVKKVVNNLQVIK